MPASCTLWHAVQGSHQLPHNVFLLWITRRRGNKHSPPATVTGQKIALDESLADVDLVHFHVVGSRQGDQGAETASMWHRTKRVGVIDRFLHVLPLANKANLELIQSTISMTLDFVVEATLKDLVHPGDKIVTVHPFDASTPFQTVHFTVLRRLPEWHQSGGATQHRIAVARIWLELVDLKRGRRSVLALGQGSMGGSRPGGGRAVEAGILKEREQSLGGVRGARLLQSKVLQACEVRLPAPYRVRDGLGVVAGHLCAKRHQISCSRVGVHDTQFEERASVLFRTPIIRPDRFSKQRNARNVPARESTGRQRNDYFMVSQSLASLQPGELIPRVL